MKVARNEKCPCGSGIKYKKCCGRVVLIPVKAKQLRAYTDETGNSGNNLFDPNQPYFWTATLVCEANLEEVGAVVHAECLRTVGKSELHGNSLGLSGIEKIAQPLAKLFMEQNCHFLFTQLEKEHLAGTKLFDTLMDSGINHAVSNLHYAVRGLRQPLAVQLIQILDDTDRRQFWTIYESGSAEGFRDLLQRLKLRLHGFHDEGLYHDRTVQLLTDGINWQSKTQSLCWKGIWVRWTRPTLSHFRYLFRCFTTCTNLQVPRSQPLFTMSRTNLLLE
jgi:hypothetical protein